MDRVPPHRCPEPVTSAWYHQRWDSLTFLHWELEPGEVQQLLPAPLRVDTFDGAAWVGLVPFEMQDVAVRVPFPGRRERTVSLPGSTRFPETNVRTYVIGPDGGRGVWFFSLDAADLAATVAARIAHALPYFWSAMSVDRGGQTISYRSRRRTLPRVGGGGHPVGSAATIRIGAAVEADELDDFLTARWGLYQVRGDKVRYAPVEHEPWPLHEAAVVRLDDSLVGAAGLPEPDGRLVVRYSPGIDVRIGAPRSVR